MISECGGVDGMEIGRGHRSSGRNPVLLLLCPQIPHGRTWAVTVGSQRLTAWSAAQRGFNSLLLGHDYGTPREAMADQYGSVMEWWLEGRTEGTRRETCCSVASSVTILIWSHTVFSPRLTVRYSNSKLQWFFCKILRTSELQWTNSR
jgi:hypothetical protein